MTRMPRIHVRILIYRTWGKVRKTEGTLVGVWHSFTAGGSAHGTHAICCNFIALHCAEFAVCLICIEISVKCVCYPG